jgi:hypothetical protein
LAKTKGIQPAKNGDFMGLNQQKAGDFYGIYL